MVTSCYCYFKFGGYLLVDKDSRISLVNQIKTSPQLPDRFYELYYNKYPNHSGGQLAYFINKNIKGLNNGECYGRVVAYNSGYTEYVYKNLALAALHLESFVSQKECLNYYADQIQFSKRGIKGLCEASKDLYNKDIENLNDKEYYHLIDIMIHPSSYKK